MVKMIKAHFWFLSFFSSLEALSHTLELFYKHSWVIFISDKPFWWSTLQNGCGMCRLWGASQEWCYLIETRYAQLCFFFFLEGLFLIWRPWGVLGLLCWVIQMKLKDLFRIKVWGSKTSRGDGGQRSPSQRPRRWRVEVQRCRYSSAAVLQAWRRPGQDQD